jgi:hypothetical protein
MRVPQAQSSKGSQKWVQILINTASQLLDQEIKSKFSLEKIQSIKWLSPLKDDEYSEYRDVDFLEKLGLSNLNRPLTEFWPARGPQWDALGKASPVGPYFLVEAKANIPELISESKADAELSVALIRQSLNETQEFLQCKACVDWTTGFYQYVNRIAHLYYLRELSGVEAYLILIYFLNDQTYIPTSRAQWDGALELEKRALGLSYHKLQRYIAEIFIDVNTLE